MIPFSYLIRHHFKLDTVVNRALPSIKRGQGSIIRLVDARKMSSIKIKTSYDVTNYRRKSDVIQGLYLFILGVDILRTLECIESNQPYFTTLIELLLEINLDRSPRSSSLLFLSAEEELYSRLVPEIKPPISN